MTFSIPTGTTKFSYFHGEIDFFKIDFSRRIWTIYNEKRNDWEACDMNSFSRYQTIRDIIEINDFIKNELCYTFICF